MRNSRTDWGFVGAIATVVGVVLLLVYVTIHAVYDGVCSRRALSAGLPNHRITWTLECYGTNLSESRRLP